MRLPVTRIYGMLLGGISLIASSNSSWAGPTVKAGAIAGLGTVESTTLARRSISELDLHATPGWSFGPVGIGISGQYRIVGQLTEPSSVGGTNIRGKGLLFGPAAVLDLEPLSLQFSYDLIGAHDLSTLDPNGKAVSYRGPSGYTVILGYAVASFASMDVMLSNHSFSKIVTGGVEQSLGTDTYEETCYGLGLSLTL